MVRSRGAGLRSWTKRKATDLRNWTKRKTKRRKETWRTLPPPGDAPADTDCDHRVFWTTRRYADVLTNVTEHAQRLERERGREVTTVVVNTYKRALRHTSRTVVWVWHRATTGAATPAGILACVSRRLHKDVDLPELVARATKLGAVVGAPNVDSYKSVGQAVVDEVLDDNMNLVDEKRIATVFYRAGQPGSPRRDATGERALSNRGVRSGD